MSLTDDYIDNREFGKPIHRYPVPASEADDQLPVFAKVGRGIRGDGYKVKLIENTADTVKLAGYIIDGATGQESPTAEWTSKNISGGQLMYSYNLRPYTDPQTFTITFRLKRPGQPEWQWTTPAIPYVWDEGQSGNIGSGVATLYVKPYGGSWAEKLVYPSGMSRADFNGPDPEAPWSVNLTYGSNANADIVVPTMNELASIVGITVTNLRNIISGSGDKGLDDSANLKAYIDAKISAAITSAVNTANENADTKILNKLKAAYPTGSLYITTNNTNPSTILGFGNWSRIGDGRYLRIAPSGNAGGGTGGQNSVTKSVPLPKHFHDIAIATSAQAVGDEQYWRTRLDPSDPNYLSPSDYEAALTSGTTVQSSGFPGRVMITKADSNPRRDSDAGSDQISETKYAGVEDTSMTIETEPSYINVVVWKRNS